MPCYTPKLAFRHRSVKQPLRFVGRGAYRLDDGSDPYKSEAYLYYSRNSDWQPLALPCGGCVYCKLQNARDKGVRAVHEASYHEANCFLTLTYNDKCLPDKGHLDYGAGPAFMKRLRDRLCRDAGCKVQWSDLFTRARRESCSGICPKVLSTGCAEYGSDFGRPHYHLIIFGFDFPDKKFYKWSKNDFSSQKWRVYRSKMLEELWPFGFSEIGSVTFESASYVARYCVKKVNGDKAHSHYGDRPPERSVCVSNRVGIGRKFAEEFASQLLVNDFVVVKGVKMKLPRYYSKILEENFPVEFDKLRLKRIEKIKEIDLDATKARLLDRKRIHELKSVRLRRSYEVG